MRLEFYIIVILSNLIASINARNENSTYITMN